MNKALVLLIYLNCFISIAQTQLISFEGKAQGTTYHISYYDSKQRNFQKEIDSILVDFDNSVSTYNHNSIISKINSNDDNVIVDEYFTTCFKKAKKIWKATDGAFDPTVFPLVNAWGFGPNKKIKIEKNKIDSILQFVGFNLIELKSKKIIKKDNRVRLDFNAFAQGYSVDVISNFLKKNKIKSFVVEIGGEVFAKGKKIDGTNWNVGIEMPIDNKETENPIKATAKLENIAIATSGNYRKFIIENGIKYAHHINPKTGYPAKNNLLSASVFAKNCITSDATATGLLVMGLEKAKQYLSNHKEINAYLIYSDENGNYKIYQTEGLKSIISEN